MTPLFDANLRPVAFFDGTYLFDIDNEWVAFHDRGHVFARGGRWLGPFKDGTCQDQDGQAVAWLAGSQPTTGMKPARPMNPRLPLHPKRPLRPRTPLPPPYPLQPAGGWSKLTWAQWLGKEPVAAAVQAEADAVRIEALAAPAFEEFFRYLGDHLSDNGRDGAYFMPFPHAAFAGGLPPDKQQSFISGLDGAVGQPGWRRAWVARDARGRLIGHVDLRAHPDAYTGHRCLLGMGVDRDHRRLGLARKLLAHATRWAIEQDLRWMDLRVLSINEAAVALYRAQGFQMQGGTPDMFWIDGQSLGYLFMARKLARPGA
jgi:ribosomal protein S18 acetylase RimI-like enzyme